MYAIVKTGGKQYRVAPGDKLNIEKLPAEVGDKVVLDTICVVDGKKVEADPKKAAATKVEAVVLEQFKGDKQLVFKFKKRKNYKKLRGHRQNLTRVQITSVGSEKFTEPKKATKAKSTKTAAAKDADAKASEDKPKAKTAAKSTTKTAAKTTAAKTTKSTAAKKTTAAKTGDAKKTTAKAAPKTTKSTKSTTAKAKTTTKKAADKADEKASEE